MKHIVFLTLGLLASVSSFSQGSQKESIEELLRVTKADALIENSYTQMNQMLVGMGKQLGIKPSEQAEFDEFVAKAISLTKEEMNWQKMKEPMIQIYLKHYSEKEIQDMLAFYKTETGQSMINKMPAVILDTNMLSQKMMMNIIPKLKKMQEGLKSDIQDKRNKK